MDDITLPPDYKPSAREKFMNPRQVEYFRRKLLASRVCDVARSLARYVPGPGELLPSPCTNRPSYSRSRSAAVKVCQ